MRPDFLQQTLDFPDVTESEPGERRAASTARENVLNADDRAFHDWYRFVLSFPPHLVRDYFRAFDLGDGAVVLDPFCGTGTTLVEAKLNRLQAIGLEANPFPQFASATKTDWSMDAEALDELAQVIADRTYDQLLIHGIDDRRLATDGAISLWGLRPEAERALIKDSISPLPLHKTLVLLEEINRYKRHQAYKYCLLALGNALVTTIGNLRFGPEVGVGKLKRDVPVVSIWLRNIRCMTADLRTVQGQQHPKATVHLADARAATSVLTPCSVDAVITSPPYPNEKDYTRTTRLESVVLGFFEDMPALQNYKRTLLRSNTRGVYKNDGDDRWIREHTSIQELAERIEARRIELGKTSGFERLYGRVTKLYFGGMARHLTELTSILRPGAQLAYVVGDQASYLQVMIRTGELLAEVAERIGYRVERIDLFRTRFATATQVDLREEVVVLRWPGH